MDLFNIPFFRSYEAELGWLMRTVKELEKRLNNLYNTGLYAFVEQVLENHPEWFAKWYVSPTQYGAVGDGVTDDTEAIMNAIQANPGRTIFFPEGTYLISRTIGTSAVYNHSNSFILTPYAVLKAADNWDANTYPYMLSLGGAESANNTREPGSTYGVTGGGVIDGNNRAGGVAIMSGRHTYVNNLTITNFTGSGVYIGQGVNDGSSDANIENLTLIGTDDVNNTGVTIIGSDNNVKNVRADSVRTGMRIEGGGNYIESVHPLFMYNAAYYNDSVGFDIVQNSNTFVDCYSDGFRTAFKLTDPNYTTLTDCTAFWYSDDMDENTAIECVNNFHAEVKGFMVRFRSGASVREILKTGYDYGHGHITGLINKYDIAPTETKYKYFMMDHPETYELEWNSSTWATPTINEVVKCGNVVVVRFRAIMNAVPATGDLKTPILPLSDSSVWGMFSWGTSVTRETGRSPFWIHGWGNGSFEFPDASTNLSGHLGTAVNLVCVYVARETPLRP